MFMKKLPLSNISLIFVYMYFFIFIRLFLIIEQFLLLCMIKYVLNVI